MNAREAALSHNRVINRALSVAVGLLAITIAGCSDRNTSAPEQSTPEPETEQAKAPVGLTISNAMVIASPAAMTLGGTSQTSLTYVSAAPGTLSDAASLTIRNQTRNGSPVTVTLVNGGFDPVAIAAEDNDVLQLVIVKRNGETSLLSVPVPPRRPPVIVRTNPPKGATDVPLNARMTVVFSEPMDAATITDAIRLRRNSTDVAGAVSLSDDGLVAQLTPTEVLVTSTMYTLAIGTSAKDKSGDTLAAASTVAFSTVQQAPVATVSLFAVGILEVGAIAQFQATVRDANGSLLTGRIITWSTSNAAVATVSPTGVVSALTVGTAVIRASSQGVSGEVTVSVVSSAQGGLPSIRGTVMDDFTGAPVPTNRTLRISITDGSTPPTTLYASYKGDEGSFAFGTLPAGTYTVKFSDTNSANGMFPGLKAYNDTTATVTVVAGQTTVMQPMLLKARSPLLIVASNRCPWTLPDPPTLSDWASCDAGYWGGVSMRVSVTGVAGTATAGEQHNAEVGYDKYPEVPGQPWDRNHYSTPVFITVPGEYDVTLVRTEPFATGVPWKLVPWATTTRRVMLDRGVIFQVFDFYRAF